MNKEEYIAKYGKRAYDQMLAQKRAWYKANLEAGRASKKKWREEHPEEILANNQKYREEHPEEVKANNLRSQHEQNRKGGRHYEKNLIDNRTGLQGERNKIRDKHGNQYRPFKRIIAPDSQIHHEWIPQTAEYRGVALVESNPHRYGIINVILIIDGKITLLTEEDVKNGKKNEGRSRQELSKYRHG